LLTSASLVAVIVSVPGVEGAVYTPEELICPFAAVQVTDLSVVSPVIVATSCSELPVVAEAAFGVIATEATADPPSLPVGLGVGLGGVGEGFELFAGFAVAEGPAQPPVPNEELRAKVMIAKLAEVTAFFSTQIMERRDSLSIKLFSFNDLPASNGGYPQRGTGCHHGR